ncbi:hypothetical protein D1AOALGA4SA_6299 [Olavius algarvensis Delta 1 endosymbiont]|nr:hypothetical protein D1AOALGA4SA_6299 [Olavius algarvensis Delta 1 endosymbiont]
MTCEVFYQIPNTKHKTHDEFDFLRIHQSSIFNSGLAGVVDRHALWKPDQVRKNFLARATDTEYKTYYLGEPNLYRFCVITQLLLCLGSFAG